MENFIFIAASGGFMIQVIIYDIQNTFVHMKKLAI